MTWVLFLHILNTFIAAIGVALAGALWAIFWLKTKKDRESDREVNSRLDHISERLTTISRHLIEKETSPFIPKEEAVWVARPEKPRIIKRKERDEAEMEKPLGERNFP